MGTEFRTPNPPGSPGPAAEEQELPERCTLWQSSVSCRRAGCFPLWTGGVFAAFLLLATAFR
jgi:hypothetical protein